MKILITGTKGQVGHALTETLKDHQIIALTRQDCDLTNLDQIKQVIDRHQPDLIINPAAFTNVDQAEDQKDLAFRVNRDAPEVMAQKAREYNIPFVHFSTDYVFDGKKKGAYVESDQTNPLGVYGASKLAGEEAIKDLGGRYFIFRTSWVYSKIGRNFYLTIKRLCLEKDELSVVADQVGAPTSSDFIAKQMQNIIPKLNFTAPGIYHLVPNGRCSWYEFAKEVILEAKLEFDITKLLPIKTEDYPTKARRPLNSLLDNKSIKEAFMLKFDDWQSELKKI
ncbi:MAG: dTDP-4-dehydrorhamnose reductase [Methylophilales bacterium]|nr:dTDP-4-dehydrorhamnose reductase [Methylophilales bacterium]